MKGRIWDLVEINREVAAYMDDVQNVRWSSADIDRAVKAAVRSASHVWFEERIDATHTYAVATQRYALPVICENVLEVWLGPLTATDPKHFIPMSSWRVEGTTLVMQRVFTAYAGKTIYIYYIVRASNLIDGDLADGATNTDTSFVSAGSDFVTDGVKPGDALVITSGADAGTFYVVSVTNLTTLVLHKATTATAAGLSFHIAHFTDLPHDYLVHFAMAWLFELAARNRPAVESADIVQWANYYRQLADLDLRRNARRPRAIKRYA